MRRLAVRVKAAGAELVLAELLELSPGGLEERDCGPGEVEFALYGDRDQLPGEAAIRAVAGDALIAIETAEVADDWHLRWREFHKPLRLGSALGVRPPWEPPLGTAVEVVIDPGQAFGTGAHATTRLTLESLLLEPVSGRSAGSALGAAPAGAAPALVDLGSGSGVLSIAAVKLGWPDALALDNDPAAVVATRENAEANGVADRISVRQCDLFHDPVEAGAVTVANLLGPLLIGWSERIVTGELAGSPVIIAAGLLGSEADRIASHFAMAGYRLTARRDAEQWAALRLSL